jgi:hypothetical protein
VTTAKFNPRTAMIASACSQLAFWIPQVLEWRPSNEKTSSHSNTCTPLKYFFCFSIEWRETNHNKKQPHTNTFASNQFSFNFSW